MTLRDLLIQRAARLQEWPALSAPGWPTLRYPAFRNRVEGVALGLMAGHPAPDGRLHCRTGGPWDWACEVACACCGLVWAPDGALVAADLLGGASFNDEKGRQAYHDQEHQVQEGTLVHPGLNHGELLRRLRAGNRELGWDHATTITLPLVQISSDEVRGALWSALYAGSHAILAAGKVRDWDPGPFRGLLEP